MTGKPAVRYSAGAVALLAASFAMSCIDVQEGTPKKPATDSAGGAVVTAALLAQSGDLQSRSLRRRTAAAAGVEVDLELVAGHQASPMTV